MYMMGALCTETKIEIEIEIKWKYLNERIYASHTAHKEIQCNLHINNFSFLQTQTKKKRKNGENPKEKYDCSIDVN